MQRIRIATRRSKLALAQARAVAARLEAGASGLEAELVEIYTQGDQKSAAAAKAGAPAAAKFGKGAFVDALEDALLNGQADIAVHSMKDVPATLADAFALVAFGPRADAREALVVRDGAQERSLGDLAPGTRVGTSSARRRALLASINRGLSFEPIRGNVDTRLRRLDEGHCDVLLLACAGLDRLDLGTRIAQRIDSDVLAPAPGQGAIGVEYPAERQDVAASIAVGVEPEVERDVAAERRLVAHLEADCAMPLGVHCTAHGDDVRLIAAAADASGERLLRIELVGDDAETLADEAAVRLLALGVRDLLDAPTQ